MLSYLLRVHNTLCKKLFCIFEKWLKPFFEGRLGTRLIEFSDGKLNQSRPYNPNSEAALAAEQNVKKVFTHCNN